MPQLTKTSAVLGRAIDFYSKVNGLVILIQKPGNLLVLKSKSFLFRLNASKGIGFLLKVFGMLVLDRQ